MLESCRERCGRKYRTTTDYSLMRHIITIASERAMLEGIELEMKLKFSKKEKQMIERNRLDTSPSTKTIETLKNLSFHFSDCFNHKRKN